ncbi:MAG TPA: nucleotide exchange factor GrpE [Bryobacteraceae bacterium]|nr:nucleotide exchange factor GrpE [Bryobacteraceae bacterium]
MKAEEASVNDASAKDPNGTADSELFRVERDGYRIERDELKDLLLRRQAEFDNFRKRSERERTDYLQYAAMDMVRELLPILDDFERALKVEAPNSDYAKGVEMIYNRMADTMKKLGLEPIDTAGKAFDPHLHQAIERVETKDAEDNTVIGEFQRGYNFKGKLLRPAMVRVAVKP